jgi:uncharacterized protein YbjT (DUF2867 family)
MAQPDTMDVLVAGGHGQVARLLLGRLAAAGHRARGLIRNPAHAPDLESLGAEPVLCDLERDAVDPHVGGAHAIVFAAGAGPGSGSERKRTVDYGGAVKCVEAAERLGVRRFAMVSSIGAHDPDAGSEGMRPYLRAKADADRRLVESGLDWTIVRPGGLRDEPGTGRVAVHTDLGHSGPIPRDDVALVLFELLVQDAAIRSTFEVFTGEVPAEIAVRDL